MHWGGLDALPGGAQGHRIAAGGADERQMHMGGRGVCERSRSKALVQVEHATKYTSKSKSTQPKKRSRPANQPARLGASHGLLVQAAAGCDS